jgi:short-subunit dehydrogenase
MMRLKPLSEQVIVITGASSGIGLATTRLAAARGARAVVAARSRNALHELIAELSGKGQRAVAVVADVTSESDVQTIADEAVRAFGGFDTWVNNAAVSAYGYCLELPLADMHQIIATNYWGTVHGSRVACARLSETGGAVINVGSVVSDVAVPLQGTYAASKHAIKGWTDALRVELRHRRAPVSVTLIKPAPINTPYALHAENYLEDHTTHIPPVYTARSVAAAILYAATHPVREVTVGGSGKILSIVNTLAPSLVDRALAGPFIRATHTGRPKEGHVNLYEPSEALEEDGDYRGLTRPSLYGALATRPALTATLAAGAAVALSAWWRRAAHKRRVETPTA